MKKARDNAQVEMSTASLDERDDATDEWLPQ